MLKRFQKSGKYHVVLFILAIMLVAVVSGCGNKQAAAVPQAVAVKAMQVVQRDTPVIYEYIGQVEAKNEAQIKAKVSGNIVAKMVTGGAVVSMGQPLFQIDRRQYEAQLLSAKAQLAHSEAVLGNSRMDTVRYIKLAEQQAIPQQQLDTALYAEQQNISLVEANRAQVQLAQDNLQDTLIVAPFNGRIDINDLNVGSFVQAGQTVLSTISSGDPMFVRFSMSENEYLRFNQEGKGISLTGEWGKDLKLLLSNGTQYPLTGQVEEIDRGLSQGTGTLTFKAIFPNPQGILVPGMFARIAIQGQIQQGAILVPQRAVQELLGKTIVTIVGDGDKAERRNVKMGAKVGSYWIVEEGLTTSDRVIVEGFMKTPPGTPLKITMIQLSDLKIPAGN
jgi:membrane fusion protein (multidrug efflux system)